MPSLSTNLLSNSLGGCQHPINFPLGLITLSTSPSTIPSFQRRLNLVTFDLYSSVLEYSFKKFLRLQFRGDES